MTTNTPQPHDRLCALAERLTVELAVELNEGLTRPGAVVEVIDDTLRELHRIRAQGVTACRREWDEAMARSETLLRARKEQW